MSAEIFPLSLNIYNFGCTNKTLTILKNKKYEFEVKQVRLVSKVQMTNQTSMLKIYRQRENRIIYFFLFRFLEEEVGTIHKEI